MTNNEAGVFPRKLERKGNVALKILIAEIIVAIVVLAVVWMCEPDFLFKHEPVIEQTYSNAVSRASIVVNYTAVKPFDNNASGLLNADGEIDLLSYKPYKSVMGTDAFYQAIVDKVKEETGTEITVDAALKSGIVFTRSDETTSVVLKSSKKNGDTLGDRHMTVFADADYSSDVALNNEIAIAGLEVFGDLINNVYITEQSKGNANATFVAQEHTYTEPQVTKEPERVAPNTLLIAIIVFVIAEILALLVALEPGDWKNKLSYFIWGFGSFARGQYLRGALFLLFEIVFIGYMVFFGGQWLSMLPSLGKMGAETKEVYDETLQRTVETTVYHDNSFRILLYGVLTIFFIIAFIYTMRTQIKVNRKAELIELSGKKLRSGKDDLRSMVDDQFHKTLLALPLTGILIFTVMPIVFMILVAFTNYDGTNNGTKNLFHWVGLDNFNTMLNWSSSSGGSTQSYAATFGEVLVWTLIWAFFATFTNYFLGMFIAMMINKKGIKFKKGWRTILVLTIAIPQFISLLYVSKMFAKNGIINGTLMDLGLIKEALPFWEDAWWSRFTVIFINIWIGIPYLMLITTGILMNIPADLYESARIDGANAWQQYSKITLPYMLFITGPYLLTSFTGNMNNFNVIYLLTGGAPTNTAASGASGAVGYSDLLITWLFKITTGTNAEYYMASVVGILVFVVVAVISLVVYNLLPSIKNEEDFQ
ncbi:MAG: sugar ABC transporter permease [Clostridia bacterium]|nr:sugar ABC transporter permease [Clostridia bacterium]